MDGSCNAPGCGAPGQMTLDQASRCVDVTGRVLNDVYCTSNPAASVPSQTQDCVGFCGTWAPPLFNTTVCEALACNVSGPMPLLTGSTCMDDDNAYIINAFCHANEFPPQAKDCVGYCGDWTEPVFDVDTCNATSCNGMGHLDLVAESVCMDDNNRQIDGSLCNPYKIPDQLQTCVGACGAWTTPEFDNECYECESSLRVLNPSECILDQTSVDFAFCGDPMPISSREQHERTK